MDVQWFGQSAFRLDGGDGSVFIDPFGDMSPLIASRGMQFDYPPIETPPVDLLLVTHEHRDHNAVEVIPGAPAVVRSTAGRIQTPLGEVVAIASEHDQAAGTERGPNSIVCFQLDGLRVAHFGDFGQSALRDEQRAAIGAVDLLIVPVGGGPTIGAEQASEIVRALSPRYVVPMHYRTERISFLDPADAFLATSEHVQQLDSPAFDTDELEQADGALVVVPAAP